METNITMLDLPPNLHLKLAQLGEDSPINQELKCETNNVVEPKDKEIPETTVFC